MLCRRRGLSALVVCALFLCVGCREPAPTPSVAPTIPATIYPTPSPLATATPTLRPTPDLTTLRQDAEAAAFIGDYARAIALGQEVLAFADTGAADMRLKIGQWHLADNNAPAAIAVLQPLLAELNGLSESEVADAHVLLGRAYAAAGEGNSASAHYAAAIAAGSVISPWLHLWLGDIALNTGRLMDAVDHYRRSLAGAPRSPRSSPAARSWRWRISSPASIKLPLNNMKPSWRARSWPHIALESPGSWPRFCGLLAKPDAPTN
jgi:tetratricopeptide (TPR) repeat protein